MNKDNVKIVSASNVFNSKLNPTMKLSAEWNIKNLPSVDEIKCNLCPQTFKKNDSKLKIRKKIHANFHKLRLTNVRTASGVTFNKNVNTVKGKVEWIIG